MRNCEDYDLLARLHILKKRILYTSTLTDIIFMEKILFKKERNKMELKMKEKYGL